MSTAHAHQYDTNGNHYRCPVDGCWWVATGVQAMPGPTVARYDRSGHGHGAGVVGCPECEDLDDEDEGDAMGAAGTEPRLVTECSNPPEESCADAGCPVHGDPLGEQFRLFPMADAEEISYEAIFEARRLTELDAGRVRRRPWLTP